MAQKFKRPVPVYDPGRSLLMNEHYQIAYVTNDIEKAVSVFRARFNISDFRANDHDLPDGGTVKIRAVWIGNMMYELCCGTGPNMALYTDQAPADGDFVLKFHHFGYLVETDADWLALEEEIGRGGWKVSTKSDMPGFFRGCYIEVPELGHFLEFVQPREGLIERMNATPVA